MARCIFKGEFDYGEFEREYYIDAGGPYVIENRYEMIFHGCGDHTGEPGLLKETRQYAISYSQLREAAKRVKASAFQEIDETNWEEVLKAAKPGMKRKTKRRLGLE